MQSVNVLGHDYSIEFASEEVIPGEDTNGVIQFSKQRIFVRDDMPERHQRVVLLHEIIHAIFEASGHNDYRVDEDLTECLSYALVSLLRSNPELVAYLTK